MSSLGLLSMCRYAFSPSQSTFLPVFSKGIRSLSNTSLLSQPAQLPKVANSAENNDPKSTTWFQNSRDAMSNIANHSMLNPYSGRSVPVKGNVGDSLRLLDGILSRNKVRLQLRMTERHEKKGYKRRRLASERWRNQFANEVRKKVQLVMKMRDRGA